MRKTFEAKVRSEGCLLSSLQEVAAEKLKGGKSREGKRGDGGDLPQSQASSAQVRPPPVRRR